MDAKTKSNPIINFIRNIFARIGSSTLFEILKPDTASVTETLDLPTDSKEHERVTSVLAEEAGMSDKELKAAFKTAYNNCETLEAQTDQVPKSKKSTLEVSPATGSQVEEKKPEKKVSVKAYDDYERD